MSKPLLLSAVDEIQACEKRHYVALQMYDRALRNVTPPETLRALKQEVCDAFADLKAAHDQLLACDVAPHAANT
jgi:hypothetical protein